MSRDPASARRWSWFSVAALVLAALPVRELVRELGRGREAVTPLDVAFAPLVAALPPVGPIGWVGDGPSRHEVSTARARLQFAAAPRILAAGTEGRAVVVAWTSDEERLGRLLHAHGLRVLARFDRGYALCAPEGP